jgi:hypothetical protein
VNNLLVDITVGYNAVTALSIILPLHLSHVVVNVLATLGKGREFKPGQGNRLVRMVKIHSTPSFA